MIDTGSESCIRMGGLAFLLMGVNPDVLIVSHRERPVTAKHGGVRTTDAERTGSPLRFLLVLAASQQRV